MLLHKPYGGSENRKRAWKALVEAVEAGKVRSIGISNYGVHHLDELEHHIHELEAERGGKGEGKGGILSVNQRDVAVGAHCPILCENRLDEPALQKSTQKYGRTEAQVLIRWSLEKGLIPLPKSATTSRIIDNADVVDFSLTAEEVQELETSEYSPVAWDPTVSKLSD